MRVAKTIKLDGQTERELRVLSQPKRIEVRLATAACAHRAAGGQGDAEQRHR